MEEICMWSLETFMYGADFFDGGFSILSVSCGFDENLKTSQTTIGQNQIKDTTSIQHRHLFFKSIFLY